MGNKGYKIPHRRSLARSFIARPKVIFTFDLRLERVFDAISDFYIARNYGINDMRYLVKIRLQ